MKRIFAIAMIIGMVFTGSIGLCFGADGSSPSVSVSVEATVTASFTISENVTVHGHAYSKNITVDPFTVTNLTDDDSVITVVNVQAEGKGEWNAASLSTVDAAQKGTLSIYLAMEDDGADHDLTVDGGYAVTDGDVTTEDGSRDFVLSGKIPAQITTTDSKGTEVAKLVVTVTVGPLKYNGFTVAELQSVQWATQSDGTTSSDAEILGLIQALDAGEFTVADLMENNGFTIGASRNVIITATDGTQSTAQLVIWDANTGDDTASAKYKLTNGYGYASTDYEYTDADKKTASFIIGIQGLNQTAKISTSSPYSGSWKSLAIRQTVNAIYKTLPTDIQSMFKPFETITATGANASTIESVSDNLALTASKEVLGGSEVTNYSSTTGYSCAVEFNALTQFKYFETTANRTMYVNGAATKWWQRSPGESTSYYCYVNGTTANSTPPTNALALVPFGCI